MYGWNELKKNIMVTKDAVECPGKDCIINVPRQVKVFKSTTEFFCPEHRIYISPSTFEYEDFWSNILWKSSNDIRLLEKIMKAKRENRMAHDNSEDALTWNVFRFLEIHGLVDKFITLVTGYSTSDSKIIYWSYSQVYNGIWGMLNRARSEFEMVANRGSEPDLIIVSNDGLFIVECKFTATNENIPSNVKVEEQYLLGGQGWWTKVFFSNFKEVAVNQRLYELARYWLLGTWMATQLDLDFYLVSLVLDKKDQDIEERFKPHISQKGNQKFIRMTWEQVYEMIDAACVKDKGIIKNYFINKTIGYNKEFKLQRAFYI